MHIMLENQTGQRLFEVPDEHGDAVFDRLQTARNMKLAGEEYIRFVADLNREFGVKPRSFIRVLGSETADETGSHGPR